MSENTIPENTAVTSEPKNSGPSYSGPIPSPLINLFNRLNNRRKNTPGAFGGKRRDNHVRRIK